MSDRAEEVAGKVSDRVDQHGQPTHDRDRERDPLRPRAGVPRREFVTTLVEVEHRAHETDRRDQRQKREADRVILELRATARILRAEADIAAGLGTE